MKSIRYTEMAALEDVDKCFEFHSKYEILPSEDLKIGEVDLSDNNVVDYLGFCREVYFIKCMY